MSNPERAAAPRPRRRTHVARRSRQVTLVLSVGALAAITGGLAAEGTLAQTTATSATTANTAASPTSATSTDRSSSAAIASTNRSSGASATSSHGS